MNANTPLSLDQLALVVHAPFGDDPALSFYPGLEPAALASHPLLRHLAQVAEAGVPVLTLLDRCGEDSWLIEHRPGHVGAFRVDSHWKQDMSAAASLRGLLLEARQRFAGRQFILSLEGHGVGYMPAMDHAGMIALSKQSLNGVEWRISGQEQAPFDQNGSPVTPGGMPTTPGGMPTTPGGMPTMPGGMPTTPARHASLPTFALAEALSSARAQGMDRLAVVHFASCFNMAVEVLHTVAPHAAAAAGYCNYNFFSAAETYPAVMRRLGDAGTATPEQMAQWFIDENHALLSSRGRHPIVGGALALERMDGIAEAVDAMSDALLNAMRRGPTKREQRAVRRTIEAAIADAQQYDTSADMVLETPDQMTDLYSLASALQRHMAEDAGVRTAAERLGERLAGIKRVGDVDAPWMDDTDSVVWNFSEPTLAMSIFLPDPLRNGLWDWRTPFYVDVNPGPGPARLQTGVIDFLKVTTWVEFLAEYHRDTRFHALSVPRPPRLPLASGQVRPLAQAQLAAARAAGRPARRAPTPGPIARLVESLLPPVSEAD